MVVFISKCSSFSTTILGIKLMPLLQYYHFKKLEISHSTHCGQMESQQGMCANQKFNFIWARPDAILSGLTSQPIARKAKMQFICASTDAILSVRPMPFISAATVLFGKLTESRLGPQQPSTIRCNTIWQMKSKSLPGPSYLTLFGVTLFGKSG